MLENPDRTLSATFVAAMAVAAVGGEKLPRPSRFTAVALAWFTLGLVAAMGREPSRTAAALSLLMLLTLVMGRAGRRALAWLRGAAVRVGVPGGGGM